MRLLIWVTLGYAGILVLALAVSLIAIAALLWRISISLTDVKHALAKVRDNTEPLQRQLGAVGGAVGAASAVFANARADFERALPKVEHAA
jgi:hypothetical protein